MVVTLFMVNSREDSEKKITEERILRDVMVVCVSLATVANKIVNQHTSQFHYNTSRTTVDTITMIMLGC